MFCFQLTDAGDLRHEVTDGGMVVVVVVDVVVVVVVVMDVVVVVVVVVVVITVKVPSFRYARFPAVSFTQQLRE
jgi:hypothetical protein